MPLLTRVRLVFIHDQINVWLRFGRMTKVRTMDSSVRDAYFTPHSTFAIVTWRGGVRGTHQWRVDVLRAVTIRERASQLPHVDPGAEILLRVSGELKVRRVLALFDDVEASGTQLEAVSPDRWRCAHNRLAANQDTGVFSVDAIDAFRARRNLAR